MKKYSPSNKSNTACSTDHKNYLDELDDKFNLEDDQEEPKVPKKEKKFKFLINGNKKDA